MRDKLIIAGLLLAIGGVAGWNLNRPKPPVITYITQARENAAVAQEKAEQKKREYEEIKPVFDSSANNINVRDTVEVIRFVEVAKEADRKYQKALGDCHSALEVKNKVITAYDTIIQKIEPQQNRFTLIAEALWSHTEQTPVIRGGIAAKISGNWSLIIEGQKRLDSKMNSLLAGVRYRF